MNKKLIFLRKGMGVYLDNFPFNVDGYTLERGYKEAMREVLASDYEWYRASSPTILSATDEQGNPLWWNEERQIWDIYFIEDDGLHNIQEYTDKELRKAHNIEKMYLNGGFDD